MRITDGSSSRVSTSRRLAKFCYLNRLILGHPVDSGDPATADAVASRTKKIAGASYIGRHSPILVRATKYKRDQVMPLPGLITHVIVIDVAHFVAGQAVAGADDVDSFQAANRDEIFDGKPVGRRLRRCASRQKQER